MQIKAINSLWWSETSWHKQSVPLPWKPLSPHRPRDRKKKKTQRANEAGREWQKNSNRQTDRQTQALLQLRFMAFQSPFGAFPPVSFSLGKKKAALYLYSEFIETLFNSWWNIHKFNEHTADLQRQMHSGCRRGIFVVSREPHLSLVLVRSLFFFCQVTTFWTRGSLLERQQVYLAALRPSKAVVHALARTIQSNFHHRFSFRRGAINKIHWARTGTNRCLHFLHCSECPLHSPIYYNKARCRKLNIATRSHDVTQAVQAENRRRKGDSWYLL